MFPIRHAAFFLIVAATPVLGFEEVGKVTAIIDGQTQSWATLQAAPDEMTASLSVEKTFVQLSLSGHDPAGSLMQNMLSFSGLWLKDKVLGAEAMEPTIMLVPQSMTDPFWSSDEAPEPAQLILTVMDETATGYHLEGNFSGQVCLRTNFMTPPDLTQCKSVSGSFSTEALVD